MKDTEQVMAVKGSAFEKRIRRLRRALKEEKADGILITDLTNIRYLSGFAGSFGVLLVTLENTVFLTDFRYIETVEKNVCADEVIKVSQDHRDDVRREVRKRRIRRLAFEARTLPYSDYQRLAEKIGDKKICPLTDTVENLRMVKDDEEIACIRRAVRLTEKAFRHIEKFFEPGISERDLAAELGVFLKLTGGGQTGFEPIVAFGEACSMPHSVSTNRKLKPRDMVLVDLGVSLEGYYADLTRTWLSRSMSAKEREIYSIVLEAQQAAIERVKPGAAFRAIDDAARGVISRGGYGERFGHGLGHGIGLKVHELPWLSRKSEGRCRKGMVFTIEPGIYLPGWGGVRVEDDVLVTEKGCEVLSRFPRSPRSWL